MHNVPRTVRLLIFVTVIFGLAMTPQMAWAQTPPQATVAATDTSSLPDSTAAGETMQADGQEGSNGWINPEGEWEPAWPS